MRSKAMRMAGSIALFFPGPMLIEGSSLAADSAGEPGRRSGKKNPLLIHTEPLIKPLSIRKR
jgi:hypothetical protein